MCTFTHLRLLNFPGVCSKVPTRYLERLLLHRSEYVMYSTYSTLVVQYPVGTRSIYGKLGRTIRSRRQQDRYESCTSTAPGTLLRSYTAGSTEPSTVGNLAYPTRYPAKVTCRQGRYSRVARRSADRPSRFRRQAVRQAFGRLYTLVGASPRCRHTPRSINFVTKKYPRV
jgi:hypothetical protein